MQEPWSEQQAREMVESWHKSGLSVDRFARERGIQANRLHYWRHKFERRTENRPNAAAPLALLPVSVSRAVEGEPVTVLLRSGQGIKVGPGFDEETLVRVVAVLEGL